MKWPTDIKRIEILWLDSDACNSWTSIDEVDGKIHQTYSIGALIKETDESVTISCAYDKATNSANAIMTVPKCSIVKKRFIKW